MGLFDASPEKWAQYREMIRSDAQGRIADEVIVAAPFRRGQMTAQAAAGQLGGLAVAATRLFSKKRAGGLPEHTMLIVTPARVHAWRWKPSGRKMRLVGDEVAVWERDAIRVSTERKLNVTMLTIESPGEGEKVTLAPAYMKDDPLTQELIGVLQGAAPEPAGT